MAAIQTACLPLRTWCMEHTVCHPNLETWSSSHTPLRLFWKSPCFSSLQPEKKSGSAYSLTLKTALEVWTPVYYVILSPCSETAWAGLSCVRFQWLQAPNLPLCACRATRTKHMPCLLPLVSGQNPPVKCSRKLWQPWKHSAEREEFLITAVCQSLPIGTLIWSKIYVYILSCKGWSQLNIAYERNCSAECLLSPALECCWSSGHRHKDEAIPLCSQSSALQKWKHISARNMKYVLTVGSKRKQV